MSSRRLSVCGAALMLWMLGCSDDTAQASAGGAGPSSSSTTGTAGAGGGLQCDEPFVTKGPWALAVDGSSAKVRWEACDAAAARGIVVTPEDGGDPLTFESETETFVLGTTHEAGLNPDAPPDWAGTYYIHEASLDGLSAGTCYRYELAADAARGGRFCTARPAGEPFRFIAIGDTNPALGTTQDTVDAVLPENFDFTVHGGDVQYYDSFLETWASWFPMMQPLLSQGAFLPAIGNHESEVDAELDEYALRFFGNAGFYGKADYYGFETGGVWFFNVNTEEAITQGSEQAIWLEQQLVAAMDQPGFRFSIVYLHRPLVTCGDSDDNVPAFEFLHPIFEATKVLFVVQAHMHGYERFAFPTGPTYITTGGGGGIIQDPSENLARAYCDARVIVGDYFHSTVFDVGEEEVSIRAIDRDGSLQDSFSRVIDP